MSFLDDALSSWKDVKVAQAKQPRLVQTLEQKQVETRQNIGQVSSVPNAARAPAAPIGGFMSMIPGGRNTLLAVAGLLAVGLIVKKAKLI